jgi:hypothetical protein
MIQPHPSGPGVTGLLGGNNPRLQGSFLTPLRERGEQLCHNDFLNGFSRFPSACAREAVPADALANRTTLCKANC